MWFSLQYFCIRLKKTINVSFEEFKGRDIFFVREWLRQKTLRGI